MKKIKIIILTILLMFIFFLSPNLKIVNALESKTINEYSDVLDDLKHDEKFNVNNFVEDKKDYGLKVLQILETELNNLLIYVFQPSHNTKDLQASSINISTTLDSSGNIINYDNYQLTLLDSNGCFDKYLVENFSISNLNTRYYFISAIYRKFDESIDTDISDNTIKEINYKVGHQWKVTDLEDKTTYEYKYIDVVVIPYKHVGFIRYVENAPNLLGVESGTDRHYFAFSTDRRIDDLISVNLKYDIFTDGDRYEDYVIESKSEDISQVETGGTGFIYTFLFFGHDGYSWPRIQTLEDFKTDISNATCETVQDFDKWVEPAQWVINVCETSYISGDNGRWSGETYLPGSNHHSYLKNVQMLTMTFITDGIIYNLSVSDNIQSGNDIPDGKVDETDELRELIEKVFTFLALCILIILIINIFPILISFFGFIGSIVLFPFKIIKRIFKKK